MNQFYCAPRFCGSGIQTGSSRSGLSLLLCGGGASAETCCNARSDSNGWWLEGPIPRCHLGWNGSWIGSAVIIVTAATNIWLLHVAWDFYSTAAGFQEAAFQEEMLQETKAKASRSSDPELKSQVTFAMFYWLSVSPHWQKNVWGGGCLLKSILEKYTLHFAIFCSSSNIYPPVLQHPWSLLSESTHHSISITSSMFISWFCTIRKRFSFSWINTDP